MVRNPRNLVLAPQTGPLLRQKGPVLFQVVSVDAANREVDKLAGFSSEKQVAPAFTTEATILARRGLIRLEGRLGVEGHVFLAELVEPEQE